MTNSTTPLIELDQLAIHFATRQGPLKAVDGVSLTIQHGETLSGKAAVANPPSPVRLSGFIARLRVA